MAITKSAKKAIRVAGRKRVFNLRRKKALHDAAQALSKARVGAEAATLLPSAYRAIDKAAKRGVIHPNTAARKKSRLARLLKTS